MRIPTQRSSQDDGDDDKDDDDFEEGEIIPVVETVFCIK